MNTNDLSLFVHTADSGSITRAAEQLDISTVLASAALKRLEQQLGTQLFIRSTRQLRITAQGERFLVYSLKHW
ncbi:MAG: DNA-binding transcriptional LysR family regulator [Paraglaciecola sp.]|jgi:DNA-binding transcriptional LysR family regulator